MANLIGMYLQEVPGGVFNFSQRDNDTKYFLAPLYAVKPLRGIIWRVRKLFEVNEPGATLANKATHGQAVQLVRTVVAAMDTFFPEKQWDAAIQFFTEPIRVAEGEKAQFENMFEFQTFISDKYIPGLVKAIEEIEKLYKAEPEKEYVWDNKIGYGKSAFKDGIQRYAGNQKIEKEMVLAGLNRMLFEAYVFCAYDQSELIAFVGELGKKFGIDNLLESRKDNEFGVTDHERYEIVKSLTEKGTWLQIHKETIPTVAVNLKKGEVKRSTVGKCYMINAFASLENSVEYMSRAYEGLQARGNEEWNPFLIFDPKFFNGTENQDIKDAIDNMKGAVWGKKGFRNRISGEYVEVNLMDFYVKNPPETLFDLYANDFKKGEPIKSKNGKTYRDYRVGSATSWNNDKWKTLIPTAAGKPAGYMKSAKRVLLTTKGVSNMFGMIEIFVR